MDVEDYLIQSFPKLRKGSFRITSPFDISYNCIAWAVGENDVWWWPKPDITYYWPEGIPRISSIESFEKAFESLGFEVCENDKLEEGFEKIALFGKDSRPTHGARQLKSGFWTSKLGQDVDIEHLLSDLTGDYYGEIVKVFRRRK